MKFIFYCADRNDFSSGLLDQIASLVLWFLRKGWWYAGILRSFKVLFSNLHTIFLLQSLWFPVG
ncbi:MAG: hypothetical protein ABSG35_11320, partial [Syntrophobacteraceae bacterium]